MNLYKTTIVLLGSLLAMSASAAEAPPVNEETGLKLFVLDCGRIETRDASLFNPLLPRGAKKQMADPCYLIQHPKGMLLWDTGLPDDLAAEPKGVEAMGGAFHFSVRKTLSSQLSELGVKPTDIDFLAFSHLHSDHTGNAHLFPKATWLIQDAEYRTAMSENAKQYGYHPEDYLHLGNPVKTLKGDHDLFGDGSVVVIFTPGHTAGHQSLLVNLIETKPVLLSGDLYHFQENRIHYGIPVWNDKEETVQSFARVDRLLKSKNAALWIQHDNAEFESRKHAPRFYQ